MEAGPSGHIYGVTRMDLFEFLSTKSLLSRANTVLVRSQMVDLVKSRMPNCEEEKITKKISLYSHKLLSHWKASGRNKKSFLKRHGDWLREEISFQEVQLQQQSGSVTPIGRPRMLKDFDTVSVRTKRRRTKNLVASHTPEQLAFAAQTGFTKEGKRNVAQVIRKAITTSPRSLKKLKKTNSENIQQYTPEEALALIIDLKLTKSQYLKLRKGAQEKNCKIYPSYDNILKARKECYPKDIHVTDTMGEVKLQSLLDHTVQRLFVVQNDVISRLVTEKNIDKFEVIYKWGFDGSSSHSLYKQQFQESIDATDSDIFLTSIVPLQMRAKSDDLDEIVWMNPRASSTRFCIPIKFQFIKETQNVIQQESEYIERQILALIPTYLSIETRDVDVRHTLIQTMLDGKVANALTGNPSTLQAISCGYKLNTQKFREYAHETAKLFIQLYGWYKMPASMHKILLHGADVMDTLLLPIGQLSEEALEARHKDCRYFREHSTRETSRKENIEDLLHALLISSAIIISSVRPIPKRKVNKLPSAVINLLDVPEIAQQSEASGQGVRAEGSSQDEEESDFSDLDF